MYCYLRMISRNRYVFRRGPVPYTRCYRGGDGTRYPKTKQELTYADEGRAKRKSLPTTWDDLWRKPQRNWKSQRKTQWKGE